MLAVLKAGDEVLVVDTIYKPTRRFCDHVLKRFGVGVRYFDPRDVARGPRRGGSPAATRLIVMESPGSLTFEMQDVAADRRAGAGAGHPDRWPTTPGAPATCSSRWTTAWTSASRR